jgi:splicing factor 45
VPTTTDQFAPPAAYSFAPPPPSPPRAAPVPLPDDKTGDDAYARRLAMSQGIPPPPPPPTEPGPAGPEAQSPVPPPPPPPEPEHATISRAPVRYAQPEPTAMEGVDQEVPESQAQNEDEDDEDAPRSSRPGQKGFAARLMSKYGWSKGQGLGAEGTGILAPLSVKVEKRKKNENGGWAEPGGRGKIIQPKANPNSNNASSSTPSSADEGGKFGPMSNVIVLRHMLDNIEDAQQEMEDGLGQEIGEECGDKYGRVERIYIDTAPGGTKSVYIKFVDTVSALRAVNALDGRVFAGSSIEPRFYDLEAFEKGVYE